MNIGRNAFSTADRQISAVSPPVENHGSPFRQPPSRPSYVPGRVSIYAVAPAFAAGMALVYARAVAPVAGSCRLPVSSVEERAAALHARLRLSALAVIVNGHARNRCSPRDNQSDHCHVPSLFRRPWLSGPSRSTRPSSILQSRSTAHSIAQNRPHESHLYIRVYTRKRRLSPPLNRRQPSQLPFGFELIHTWHR